MIFTEITDILRNNIVLLT
jgi:hypothetical protein